jgi:cyclopropane fatty-acyl-phospholipid synthase-like methyltransferase
LFCGTERFFRPNYANNLLSAWIPALDGVKEKLASGGSVADVGCGHGASTMLMAKAFPKSHFCGFDYHSGSIEYARHVAGSEGLLDQIGFEVASSKSYPVNAKTPALSGCLRALMSRIHLFAAPVGSPRE